MPSPRRPGAGEIREALRLCVSAWEQLPNDAWDVPAFHLEWTCRETAAHVLGDLGAYAMQLSTERTHPCAYTPLSGLHPHPNRPAVWFWPEEDRGTAGLVHCLDALGGLLVAVVQVAPGTRRGWHPYGESDPSGFAAMGMTELLVHTYDILMAHDLGFCAPDLVVEPVLDRIFPAQDRDGGAWRTLLAATGRTEQTRGRSWRWDSSVSANPGG